LKLVSRRMTSTTYSLVVDRSGDIASKGIGSPK
jgi:hypothetical protein